MNVLSRGDDVASALGVAVPRATLALHAVAALATAAAVTTAGTVGFVGLIVPHALRLAIGNDQRVLLPAAALAGGTLLVLADTLARSIAAPVQLPVGVITALIGVPAFLYLLARTRRRANERRRVASCVPRPRGRHRGPHAVRRTSISTCAPASAGRSSGRTARERRRWSQCSRDCGRRRPGRLRTTALRLTTLSPRERALKRGWLPQDSVDFFPASVLETVLDRPASASRAFRVGIRGRRRPRARGARAVRSRRLRGRATCGRCRVASGGGWRWPRSSRRSRTSCCWTSRRRTSISGSRSPRSMRFRRSRASAARRWSWCCTISTSRCAMPISRSRWAAAAPSPGPPTTCSPPMRCRALFGHPLAAVGEGSTRTLLPG